ncbi:hypothetical protein EHP00_567 [Ecytonucleospora hepatopenaei]|uniref:Translation initiation factor IF2/IF5 domain-containing protein n=1 Tax=Ecytonucleospora hepatopenaei TaxID=646526 RepID=A0A1W0E8P0_9MICR|nr:hypothetical protein EHP00_567 [Ecytonucleospora hepatopenaei]
MIIENDSVSSSSEEDYVPVGFSQVNLNLSNLNCKKPETVNVFVKKTVDDSFDLMPQLQYEYLLNRADEYLKQTIDNNKKSIKLNVTRRNRKTQINIQEVAEQLHRQTEHLSRFMLKGLFSEGTVNEKGILNVDGRFVQSEVENVIKTFIAEYVVCKSCENMNNTVIIKKNRLFFVKCNSCGSERCVGNVIDGYVSNK